MKKTLILFTLLFAFTMNIDAQSNTIQEKNNIIKVYVDARGKIFVNDKKVSLRRLSKQLEKEKKGRVTVHFSSVHNQKKSTEAGTKVLRLISKHQFSIKTFTDKSFTKLAEW